MESMESMENMKSKETMETMGKGQTRAKDKEERRPTGMARAKVRMMKVGVTEK